MALGLFLIFAAVTVEMPKSVDAISTCDTATFVQGQKLENEKIRAEIESIAKDAQPLLKLQSDLVYYRAESNLADVKGESRPKKYVDFKGNIYGLKKAEKMIQLIDSQLETIKLRNFLVKVQQDSLERSLYIFRVKCRGSENAPNQ